MIFKINIYGNKIKYSVYSNVKKYYIAIQISQKSKSKEANKNQK